MSIPNKTCPRCGAELAPEANEGLCPKCLLAGCLGTDSGSAATVVTPVPEDGGKDEHRTYNLEHRTSNAQHPTSNAQRASEEGQKADLKTATYNSQFAIGLVWLFLACGVLSPPLCWPAPTLLANYTFHGNGNDDTGNCPPMQFYNTRFVGHSLFLDGTNQANAWAIITNLSYNSFTVALDFNAVFFSNEYGTVLSGGPLHRWLGIHQYDWDGCLTIKLNNMSRQFPFPGVVLTTNAWHTIICSVDVPGQRIITYLDGQKLPDIVLQNFLFDVVDTPYEQSAKVFEFRNGGDASHFWGHVDNLMVFNRALAPAEIESWLFPRLNITRQGNLHLIHWSSALNGYVLETCDRLSGTNQWQRLATPPVLIGDQNLLIFDTRNAQQFYRLQR